VEDYLRSFLIPALDGGQWAASRLSRLNQEVRASATHWVGGCFGLSAGLGISENRKISWFCGELNYDSLVVQTVKSSLHRLRYSSSHCCVEWCLNVIHFIWFHALSNCTTFWISSQLYVGNGIPRELIKCCTLYSVVSNPSAGWRISVSTEHRDCVSYRPTGSVSRTVRQIHKEALRRLPNYGFSLHGAV
jgi:hypothetical protein